MAYSLGDLDREIEIKIEGMKENGAEEIPADWVAHAVMADHPNIDGDDAPFHACCSQKTVRDAVRRIVSRYSPKATIEADRQTTLPGFERLQTHYLVERQKQQVIVRVDVASDAELLDKASEYDAMAIGCSLHAAEIRRYVEMRKASKAA